MGRKLGWWWLVLYAGSGLLAAQAATSNEFLDMSLEDLVDYRLMSISRKEQRVADTAAAAHVISAEEIRRSGALSIPEALRGVPGLNVAQIARNRWAVSSRGFNERFAGKLLVLVDGRNVYSPTFSGVLWETLDMVMEDIERIEVIRGPGAALWGTNAMNGVINIVTRSAAASTGSLAGVVAGSGGQTSVSLRHAGVLDQGGHYKLYGKRSSADGSVERETGRAGEDGTRQARVGLQLEPRLDKGTLSIKAEAYEGLANDVWLSPAVLANSDPATPYARAAWLQGRNQGGSLQARYAWTDADGADNIVQSFVDHESWMNAGRWGSGTGVQPPLVQPLAQTSFGGRKTDLDVDFQQRRVGGAHDFIWGLNLRYTTDHMVLQVGPYLLLDGVNRRVNYSAFVHDEITLEPERLKLILGSKFERDGLTGFNLQPNARVLWTPRHDEAYWAALSRSVRSLRRFESFATVDFWAQDAAQLNAQTSLNLPANVLSAVTRVSPMGNAAVQAESAWSLETGWRRQFGNELSVDAAVFMTDYSHLRGARMQANPVTGLPQAMACLATYGPGNCYFVLAGYNTSQDKARAWGAELAAEWRPRPGWTVQMAYSHLRIKGERSGDPFGDWVVSGFENSSPRHQFVLGSNWRMAPDLNLHAQLRHSTSTTYASSSDAAMQVVPGYTELDMRLAWRLNRQTELSLMGRNLLRSRHSEFINLLPPTRAYDVQRSLLAQAVIRF